MLPKGVGHHGPHLENLGRVFATDHDMPNKVEEKSGVSFNRRIFKSN
jgi:hypothetical protein